MPRLAPADEFDNAERIRRLVDGIIESDPRCAENLVILLRLITNPEKSQSANSWATYEAVNHAFSMTCAFSGALEDFVGQPLKAVA